MDNYDVLKAQKDRIERLGAEAMADRIVERLFVNAFGDRATTLQLVSDSTGRNLGGWSQQGARGQIILAILNSAGYDATGRQ